MSSIETTPKRGYTTLGIAVFAVFACIIAGVAALAVQAARINGYDALAHADYRRLKVAVFRAVSDRSGPDRFAFFNYQGPQAFEAPLGSLELSAGVRADIVHNTKRSRNERPITVTRVEVFHPSGSKAFRYVEVNGIITEQVIERSA